MPADVKICCIRSVDEAQMAADAGAGLIGLVGPMPSGPGVLTLNVAEEIARSAPPGVRRVLLSASATAGDLLRDCMRAGTYALQVVRHVPAAVHVRLAGLNPDIERIQVVHVEGRSAIDLVREYSPVVDAIILDSGQPSTGRLGGTGKTHDWNISRECVDAASTPVFLAGGLTPDNVAEAIARVRPDGVDICSGISTDGILDRLKLDAFMQAVRTAS
ncbi:MAG: phosphoribosylanthranilate isomerase [Pseudomonadota bacterium]